jgi:hypothetical protein
LEKAAGPPLPQPDETVHEDALAAGADEPAGLPHLADSIGLLLASEARLIRGWDKLRESHPTTPDIGPQSRLFAIWSRENAAAVRLYVDKYGERREGEPEALDRALPIGRPPTAFGLLRDLQDLWLMVNESTISVAALLQGACALGDRALEQDLRGVEDRNARQRAWLLTRIRQAAPQTLTVPS